MKKYIGCTIVNPITRWSRHKSSAKTGSDTHLHRAIRKYGIENFRLEVIEECLSIDKMKEAEIEWIAEFDTFHGDGYNMTAGGEGSFGRSGELHPFYGKFGKDAPFYGHRHTEESKRKISKAGKGIMKKPLSDEHKEKLRVFHTGKKLSKKHKQSISDGSATKVKVMQIDKLTNIVIATFNSIKEAADFHNIDNRHISRACKYTTRTAGGYYWNKL